ncbi:MAG: hypothetical protein HOB18_04990 [Nitrospina sp.]|nr:hypothetical protein [Nitrospina sp.]
MNIVLKQALAVHEIPAYKIAEKVGRSPGWLSMVIRGMAEPSELEKQVIADSLERRVGELFPANSEVL